MSERDKQQNNAQQSNAQERDRQGQQQGGQGRFSYGASADNYTLDIGGMTIGAVNGRPFMLNPAGKGSWSRDDRITHLEILIARERGVLERLETYLRQYQATSDTQTQILSDDPALTLTHRGSTQQQVDQSHEQLRRQTRGASQETVSA